MLLLNSFLKEVKQKFDINVLDKIETKQYDYLVYSGHNTIKPPKITVSKLKSMCKQKGLKVSGKKKDLLSRINEKDISDTINMIEKKFQISRSSLNTIFDSFKKTYTKNDNSSYLTTSQDSSESFVNLKVSELKKKCKEKGLKLSGCKKDLIKRLNNVNKKSNGIISKLCSINSVVISRNEFGRYVHRDTQFVFDPETKMVIGKQSENGEVIGLSKEDVKRCQHYSFDFILPENLNSLDDVDDSNIEQNDIFDLNKLRNTEEEDFFESDVDSD